MSDSVTISLCVLWEGELRNAARLLKIANELHDGDKDTQDAINQAWAACSLALHGLTPEKAVVMLASDEIRKRVGRNPK